jgi:hypothetical protein
MSDWSYQSGGVSEEFGHVAASSITTAFTCGASVNTKGAWTALGTTTRHTTRMKVSLNVPSAVQRDLLVDIGVGAGGSEVVLFPNLVLSCGSSQDNGHHYEFPCNIPAGTSISVRGQGSTVGSATGWAQIHCIADGLLTPRGGIVFAIGANTSTSAGVDINEPSSTANTKGSYSEITSSTDYPIRQLWLAQTNLKSATVSQLHRLADIAVGAASSEQIIVPDLSLRAWDGPDHHMPNVLGPIPVNIPAGTRIAIRSQLDLSVVSPKWNCVLYGVS